VVSLGLGIRRWLENALRFQVEGGGVRVEGLRVYEFFIMKGGG